MLLEIKKVDGTGKTENRDKDYDKNKEAKQKKIPDTLNTESHHVIENKKGKYITSFFRDSLINIRSNKKEKIENNEITTVSLASKEINWVRRMLEADRNPNIEKRKALKNGVDREIQEEFLKADEYIKTIYQNVGRLTSGVYSAYEVAKNIIPSLKENEGLYFNSRLDAIDSVDYIKILFNEENFNPEEVIFIQVKNKEPEEKEKMEILEKHKKYIQTGKEHFKSLEESVLKVLSENENIIKSSELFESVCEMAEEEIIMSSKTSEVIERLAVDIGNINGDKKMGRLKYLLDQNDESIYEFITELYPDGMNKILVSLDNIFNKIKLDKEAYEKYMIGDNIYIHNNLLSAKSFKSLIMFLDNTGKVKSLEEKEIKSLT